MFRYETNKGDSMTIFLLMAIRVIILFLPVAVLIALLVKKQLKVVGIIIVIMLFCNSIFMLFSNTTQKNIIDMNSADMNIISEFFKDIDINENKKNTENIYIYDDENEFNQIANFTDITYKKYPAETSVNDSLKEIVSESALLNEVPELLENNSGIRYYVSDPKGNVSLWNLLYTNSIYNGCIIIEDSNNLYYIEYEVELYGSDSTVSDVLDQALYKYKFKHKIDVMKFFES